MKHGSLFSGVGGFELAAEWIGWENVFSCEINPFGNKILNYYWPKAIHYDDITKTSFTIHRGQIDILTGGFPCQPFSLAGKRKGTEDDRHLWPEMLRAIQEISPKYIVGENVPGLINWDGGLVFEQVQADLENEGYEVWPVVLPAAGVNAPHRRDRVWFLAYSGDKRCNNGSDNRKERHVQSNEWTAEKNKSERKRRKCGIREISSTTPDTGLQRPKIRQEQSMGTVKLCEESTTPDTLRRRQSGKEHGQKESGRITETSVPTDWENFPTQSPICSGNDGISSRLDGITFPKWRNESIKAMGNAIVPQVAFQIFKAIEDCENNRQ